MLAFYRVPDIAQLDRFIETQGDGFNLKQIYLGCISFEDHLKLEKNLPKMSISHFEDSHINLAQTKELKLACEVIISSINTSQNGSSVPASLNNLSSILENAISFNDGILTICD